VGCRAKNPGNGKPVVGAILMQQDQFFRSNELGMREAAEKLGIDLRVQNATAALDKEIGLIETYITQKVQAIVVSPLNSRTSWPALRRASDAGIHIIQYNNSVEDPIGDCRITSDQTSLGASTGRVARDFVQNRKGGKAKIALIGYATQNPEQYGARVFGF